jgi:hypothetical protein
MCIVFASAAFAACGGSDGPTLSRAAFTKQANTECAELLVAGTELFSEESARATGPAVADILGSAAESLRELARSFDELTPPEDLTENVDRLVAEIDEYADGLDDLAAKVEPGQSLAGVQATNPDLVRPLNAISTRIDALIGKLALTGCVTL